MVGPKLPQYLVKYFIDMKIITEYKTINEELFKLIPKWLLYIPKPLAKIYISKVLEIYVGYITDNNNLIQPFVIGIYQKGKLIKKINFNY